VTDLVPPCLPFLPPWLRVALLSGRFGRTTFDEATWPTAKTTLARALQIRSALAKVPWWN
jgi:hypothetical protein